MDLDDETPIEESVCEITNVKYENFAMSYQQIDNTVQLKEKCAKIITRHHCDGTQIVEQLYKIAQEQTITQPETTEKFIQIVKDYCFFIETTTPEEAIYMIKTNWNPFELYEDQYEKEIRNLENPVKIQEVDGIYECKKCGSTKTYYWSAQLRRSDEPPTTFINCINCKNKWVDNG